MDTRAALNYTCLDVFLSLSVSHPLSFMFSMLLSGIFLYFSEDTSLKNVIHTAYWVPLTCPSLILTARVELISPCLQSASFPRAAATKFRVPAKIMSFGRYRPRHSEVVSFGSRPWCWTKLWSASRELSRGYLRAKKTTKAYRARDRRLVFVVLGLRDYKFNVKNWSGVLVKN